MTKSMDTSGVAEMDRPERLKYFKIIDQLRAFGINEDLPLPQIVVVGDQSSGKSSVLEGLTGLSFPIASDLCTRFATQIVLRRTPCEKARVKASIVPGSSALDNEEEKERLLSFSFEEELENLSGSKFAWILDEAAEFMGLPGSEDSSLDDLEKRFSDDILRIELCGPDQHHLSVVDVPGLFHNPTKYQTREDLDIIRRLIEDYTRDSRTIILAVMDARNNLANQEVFKIARAADPKGIRTVGIITKCDALQPGDEQLVLKIAQNEVERLQHGWFVVRNRTTKEIQDGVTIAQRHTNEMSFFRSAPWNDLPKDHVGIRALKPFLGQLLYEHIRREFPGLLQEIEALYLDTKKRLDSLGASRQTAAEQRQYLTRMANKYQRNVEDALTGNYGTDLDAKSKLKLRMHLRTLADDFEREIRTNGHTRPFQRVDGKIDEAYFDADSTVESIDESSDILAWIRQVYLDSRGSELPGTINPAVMASLFRQQTQNWENIATTYLSKAIALVTEYNQEESTQLADDEPVRTQIQSFIKRRMHSSEESARHQLQCLLANERNGILQTVNHYYAETLNKSREERVIARLQAVGINEYGDKRLSLEKLTKAVHLGNDDQAVNDIHDILKAYYQVAVKRFEDYVVIMVVEKEVLGQEGPLRALTSDYVGGLSDDELATIAAESYSTARLRVEIEQKCKRLAQALALAKSI